MPENEKGKQSETGAKETAEHAKPEVIFTYEFDADDQYEFRSIDSALDMSTILFHTQEKIKRNKTSTHYIAIGDDEPIDLRELSESDEDDLMDSRCSRNYMSPNGQYVTFSCAGDDRWFMVYDTSEGKIIHHEEQSDDAHSFDLLGISDDMEVFLKDRDRDAERVVIKNLETNDTESFDISALLGQDIDIKKVHPADNGKTFFLESFDGLYVLDVESGQVDEILDVEPYDERFKDETDEILLQNVKISPNGKYAYFLLMDSSSKDDVYRSYYYVNLETNEMHAHNDPSYRIGYRPIDNNGNVVLEDDGELMLYNIDDEKAYLIPNAKAGVYTKHLMLTGDGKHLLYEDRVEKSDEQKVYELYKLQIVGTKNYEEVELDVDKEDIEALLKESGESASKDDGLDLYPVEVDVKEVFEQGWEKSADVPFPSRFPADVKQISTYFTLDSYQQTISLDPVELISRLKIEFRAVDYSNDDKKDYCIDDDLELEKTEDGIDYYFYLFNNKEAELSYVDGDWCYKIEGDGFTKEEMFDVVDSMETQGKQPEELPLKDVKFPTELPFKDPDLRRIQTSGSYFIAEYRGDRDDIKIDLSISEKEPNFYDHDDTESVELENDMEGFYYDDTDKPRLFMYDGTYYYTIETKIKNEEIQEIGGRDNLKETFIQIGNSVE